MPTEADMIQVEYLDDDYLDRGHKQYSFLYDRERFNLYVSKMGHETMFEFIDGLSKDDDVCGGHFDPVTNRFWRTNGTVDNVPEHLIEDIIDAINREYKTVLRWVR